jgi:hypothetical protein
MCYIPSCEVKGRTAGQETPCFYEVLKFMTVFQRFDTEGLENILKVTAQFSRSCLLFVFYLCRSATNISPNADRDSLDNRCQISCCLAYPYEDKSSKYNSITL